MMPMDYFSLTLCEAKKLLEKGEVSSVQLTESVLWRIDAVEDRVKSFITLDREGALSRADEADRTRQEGGGGELCGLPIGVKDVLCTSDMKTTCGSRILENFVPPYDATVMNKLKEAGAVTVGKLAMDEFAMGSTSENCAYGIPENPWRLGYVTGGSSGGSASCVAADESLAAIGSDTGGSIRQPASLCGIVGLKPTYGRVSRYGLVAFASSLDQIGPMTKDVSDCALMMNVISGYDDRDSTSINTPVPDYSLALMDGMKGMTVGVPAEYFGEGLDPEVEKVVRGGIDMLKESGAEVKEISLPHMEYCVAVYYLVAPAEASSNLARYDGVRYGYEVKRRILIGTYALSAGYYDPYYKKASQVRTLIKEDFTKAYAECDVIVSPVTPTPAWKIGEKANDPLSLYLSDILTISANLAGIPGMSVPAGFSSDGLPIGIQLQAAHFNEEVLLRAAWNIEQRAGVKGKRPDLG
jgi:aspartyl-tRNA(Asn)/glutamyl-tRNA(Gln) amidotransferase subunit A